MVGDNKQKQLRVASCVDLWMVNIMDGWVMVMVAVMLKMMIMMVAVVVMIMGD
jgi:hypothetical protein